VTFACIAKAALGHTYCGRQEPLEFQFNDAGYAAAHYTGELRDARLPPGLVACPECVAEVKRMRAAAK
jgi:hypothetical protein